MTQPATLEALPLALLEDICATVAAIHQPSLHALSLVCKPCRCAASRLLFRSLHLDVRHTQQLCNDVTGLSHGLEAFDSFKYVRRLHITGELSLLDPGDGDGDSIESPTAYPRQDQEITETWSLLARLIERLSALEDLVFKSRTPFPPSLLAALHSQPKSACRLHLHGFCPHGLLLGSLGDTSKPARLDPYALQLLKSINLYRIGFCLHKSINLYHIGFCHHNVTCTADDRMARDEADYIIEAILELALHYSPNLQEIVCLWRAVTDARSPPELEIIHTTPWSGLLLEYAGTQASAREKRKLTSLTVGWRFGTFPPIGPWIRSHGERGSIDHYMIDAWNQRIDFAALRTLKLVTYVQPMAMNWLITNARRFASLSVLHVHASREYHNFIRAVCPLVELKILGVPTLRGFPYDFFDQHSQTLRRLSLLGIVRVFPPHIHDPSSFVCSSGIIKEFRLRCPVLEELTVLIQRTQGDSDELAIYHELGFHPCLRKINLITDCSVDVRGEPTSEDFLDEHPFDWPERGDTETSNSHIFQSLKNCAIDETLVAEIFSTIAAAKSTTSNPLECLTIQVSNAGKFVDNVRHRPRVTIHPPSYPADKHMYLWEPIFDHFTRKWIATPNHNIDAQDEVFVEEDMEAFAFQHEEERDWYDQDGKDPVLGSVESHFRELWPDKSTGGPRNEWHSFPLWQQGD